MSNIIACVADGFSSNEREDACRKITEVYMSRIGKKNDLSSMEMDQLAQIANAIAVNDISILDAESIKFVDCIINEAVQHLERVGKVLTFYVKVVFSCVCAFRRHFDEGKGVRRHG